MEWKKTPDWLVQFLDESMAGVKAERRKMFGYPCYFINNNMCTGTFQEDLFLRLGAEDRKRTVAEHQGVKTFEPRPGRKMSEYLVVPKSLRDDPPRFNELLRRSVEYVSSLPPKPKKGKKASG